MSIDSKAKRSSALGFGVPFYITIPAPDNSVDQEDRIALLHSYSGIVPEELTVTIIDVVPSTSVYAGQVLYAIGSGFSASGNTVTLSQGATEATAEVKSEGITTIEFYAPSGLSGSWTVQITTNLGVVGIQADAFQYATLPTGRPARTTLREAFLNCLLSITEDNGYYINILRAYDPPKSIEKFVEYWSANLYWGTERRREDRYAGNNARYDLSLPVTIDLWSRSSKYESIVDEQDNALASIQKYFGENFYVPDVNGNRTAFEALYIEATPFGDAETMPYFGIRIEMELIYHIRVNNPEVMN